MRIILSLFVCLVASSLMFDATQAQEVRKAIRDYRTERPITYSPSDPWTRGKVFNTHTGNYGWFYNCDGQEDKRNSPYICWKTHYEKDIPPRRGFWGGIKMDVAAVRQRVNDGAGACCQSDCQCAECNQTSSNGHVESCQLCESQTAMDATATSLATSVPTRIGKQEVEVAKTASSSSKPVASKKLLGLSPAKPKYGLVSGGTVTDLSESQSVAEKPKSVSKVQVAERFDWFSRRR